MDNKIMDLINTAIDRLPARSKKKKFRERQYVEAKKELCARFPGDDEYQYICKAVAKKYGR